MNASHALRIAMKVFTLIHNRIDMKQKKITIIISYDYEDKNTVSNDRIAERIKSDLRKGSNPVHERIESIVVEDNLVTWK